MGCSDTSALLTTRGADVAAAPSLRRGREAQGSENERIELLMNDFSIR